MRLLASFLLVAVEMVVGLCCWFGVLIWCGVVVGCGVKVYIVIYRVIMFVCPVYICLLLLLLWYVWMFIVCGMFRGLHSFLDLFGCFIVVI